jgi:hypothetical protein
MPKTQNRPGRMKADIAYPPERPSAVASQYQPAPQMAVATKRRAMRPGFDVTGMRMVPQRGRRCRRRLASYQPQKPPNPRPTIMKATTLRARIGPPFCYSSPPWWLRPRVMTRAETLAGAAARGGGGGGVTRTRSEYQMTLAGMARALRGPLSGTRPASVSGSRWRRR